MGKSKTQRISVRESGNVKRWLTETAALPYHVRNQWRHIYLPYPTDFTQKGRLSLIRAENLWHISLQH